MAALQCRYPSGVRPPHLEDIWALQQVPQVLHRRLPCRWGHPRKRKHMHLPAGAPGGAARRGIQCDGSQAAVGLARTGEGELTGRRKRRRNGRHLCFSGSDLGARLEGLLLRLGLPQQLRRRRHRQGLHLCLSVCLPPCSWPCGSMTDP